MNFTSSERRGLIALAVILTLTVVAVTFMRGGADPEAVAAAESDTVVAQTAIIQSDTVAPDSATTYTRRHSRKKRKKSSRQVRLYQPRDILGDTVRKCR